jgi:hypothetical protein
MGISLREPERAMRVSRTQVIATVVCTAVATMLGEQGE